MTQASLYSLIVGLLIGGLIYWVSTVVPENMAPLDKILRFIGGLVIVLVVVNFILALLGFPPLVQIG